MTSTRTWRKSQFSRSTEVYVEITQQPGTDGMPRTEHNILAAVMPKGHHWQADVWPELTPNKVTLPPQLTKEGAMQKVMDYYTERDHAPTPRP